MSPGSNVARIVILQDFLPGQSSEIGYVKLTEMGNFKICIDSDKKDSF